MKINGLRWIILSLIMLVSIINYLDRGTLNYMWVANTKSEYPADRAVYDAADGTYTLTAADGTTVVAPADRVAQQADGSYVYTAVGGIAAELGILDPAMPEAEFKAQSKKLLADITIFFMIAYGLSQLFSGKLYDRIGTRRGFAFSALLWGAADAFTAFAAGFKSLTAFRFMLGLGEAGPWPGTTKSNAEWFPTKERALAQGLFNASTSVGSILAPIVISFLYLAFGWKATFAVVGSLAVLWIIPWLWVNKKGPKEHPWITDKERDYILSGQPEGHKTEPCRCKSWGELLREIREVAMSAWVPYVGAAIGAFAGGWFSGLLQKRGRSLNFARKCSMIVGVCIALPGVVGATMASSATFAVVMMALILGGYRFVQSNLMTLAADFHYGRTVGSLAGLGGAAAVLGTILAMIVVPMITRAGWAPFFIFGGLLFPVSLLAVFLFGGRIQNIDEEKQR